MAVEEYRAERTLRTWQTEAIAASAEAISRGTSPVVSAIMGAGKSIAIAETARRMHERGIDVIVTVPTQQLVRQQAEAMRDWIGPHVPIGEWYADKKTVERITVACQMSLHTLDVYPAPLAWIADECHKTECDTVLEWSERQATKYRIGYTATPFRAEVRESVSLFDELCYEYTVADAIRDGAIVPPRVQYPMTGGNLDDVCVDWIWRNAGERAGVVNAVSITDANAFAMRLEMDGINASAVHSQMSTDEIDAVLSAFRHGTGRRVLVYVNMLSEGYNEPAIDWMVLRRNVGSRVRFAQEVGRGLRARDGKTGCDIFDPCGLFDRHSLSWEACLGGGVTNERDKLREMVERIEGTGTGELEERELRARAVPLARAWLLTTRIDMQSQGLSELKVSSTHWRSDDASEKQLAYLRHRCLGLKGMDLPDDVLAKLRLCYQEREQLKKGGVSDMIEVVDVITTQGSWPIGGEG